MSDHPDDPLTRALSALVDVQSQATDARFVTALEGIRTTLLAAGAEREALLDASRKAMRLFDALDNFEAAQDHGSEKLILRRGDTGEAAESALVMPSTVS